MCFEITHPFVSHSPLVKHPLASVGYLDTSTVYCNYDVIIIVCPDTAGDVNFILLILLHMWP
jgi:hypothetical protein